MPHAVAERAVDEAPTRRGAVQPADLERRLVEVLDLEDLAGLPIPRHDLVTHLVHRGVAGLNGVGMRPAGRDDQVQLRLDPDVVHVVGRGERMLNVPSLSSFTSAPGLPPSFEPSIAIITPPGTA